MNKTNLQDVFLNNARIDHTVLTVFLVNGVKLQGVVKGFDSFIVVLDVGGTQQVIYKHAISTMIPSKQIKLSPQEDSEQEI